MNMNRNRKTPQSNFLYLFPFLSKNFWQDYLRETSILLHVLFFFIIGSSLILLFIMMRVDIILVEKEIKKNTQKYDDLFRKNKTLQAGIRSLNTGKNLNSNQLEILPATEKFSINEYLQGKQRTSQKTVIIQLELPRSR